MIAITRQLSASIGRCELTHLPRVAIDVPRAGAQHLAYEEILRRLGCDVQRLPSADDAADAVFVEDTAVVLPELAIITRPGAVSRRNEIDDVARSLRAFRELVHITPPATVDGGDVLVVGRRVFVGQTERTNHDGYEQVRDLLAPLGYTVAAASPRHCLHLKSAVTMLDPETLLLNPGWIDRDLFTGVRCLEVDCSEPFAANVLAVNGSVVCAAAYPYTADRLQRCGYDVRLAVVDELAKAEGALTCCSLLVPVAAG